MIKQYKVRWVSKLTQYRGEGQFIAEISAKDACVAMNRKYPNMQHEAWSRKSYNKLISRRY